MLSINNNQMQQMGDANPNAPVVQPCVKTWIEIVLVDDDQKPVAGAKYKARLADASAWEGSLDDNGKARIDGIVPGQATVTFPEIDGREWKPA